jgi:hypothetical protein
MHTYTLEINFPTGKIGQKFTTYDAAWSEYEVARYSSQNNYPVRLIRNATKSKPAVVVHRNAKASYKI